MPFDITSRNITSRPSLSAMTTGGYQMYQKPNPNDPVATLQRSNVASGDPRRAMSTAQLRDDARLTDQADAAKDAAYAQQQQREGRIDTVGAQQMKSMNRSAQASSPWTLFMQALKNQGADHVSTSAAAQVSQGGGTDLGFYDTQRPSMNGLIDVAKQGRQQQVNNYMANENAAQYQNSRRY